MRPIVGLVVIVAGLSGMAGASPSDELYRPRVRVTRDPRAYYSDALFRKMGEPRPGDWMLEHPEDPQSFSRYTRSRPNRPTKKRHWIVLQPLGTLRAKAHGQMKTLGEYLKTYYTLPVRALPRIPLRNVKSRENPLYGRTIRQYNTLEIMNKVLRARVATGTFCLLGVTMEDLYNREDWNYVFGHASFAHRVGVYSLVRFYPEFRGENETEATERLGLRRSLKTLVHEVGHMFGIHHCQKYECVMNGSNSLAESDRRPLHLCPECLKKFRWNIGFDIAERYKALKTFYEKHEMKAEAEWVAKRLRECRNESAEPEKAKTEGNQK